MSNSLSATSAIAGLALDYAPPSIRESLLKDSGFREQYQLPTVSVLSFEDFTVQFSVLSDAIRSVLSGSASEEVIDESNNKWQIRNTSPEGKLPNLVIYGDVERTLPPIFTALSPDKKTRLSSFDLAAHDVNLPECTSEYWREVLSIRALNNEEIFDIDDDFRYTPMGTSIKLDSEISGGESTITSLVPPSRVYFERLVGKFDGSPDIRAYATGSGKSLFDQLSKWRPIDGFLLSLFLSSHSSLTDEIDIDKLSCEDLVKAYTYLVTNGDRFSQLGAVEVGLRVLPSRPELEEPLVRLIEIIRDDSADKPTSAFKLLSTLFCFVDGELARIRLFSETPPFYRRLAAMSQASLVHRQLVYSSVDIDRFCDMMPDDRRFQHYVQSLTDMRKEPRWDPRFTAPAQMKSEFIGRIMISADRFKGTITNSQVCELLYSEESTSLRKYSNLFHSYLPGPLEGKEKTQVDLPQEFAEMIKDQLGSNLTTPSSFTALVNLGLVFGLSKELSELAVHTLKSGNYRLRNVETRRQLVATLYGLAAVAAATRNTALSDALRIVVRKYREDSSYVLSIQEMTNVNLTAAASHSELNNWVDFVGECMSDIAFGDLNGDDGLQCYVYLIGLCHAVPELWVSCGKAAAALAAFNEK